MSRESRERRERSTARHRRLHGLREDLVRLVRTAEADGYPIAELRADVFFYAVGLMGTGEVDLSAHNFDEVDWLDESELLQRFCVAVGDNQPGGYQGAPAGRTSGLAPTPEEPILPIR